MGDFWLVYLVHYLFFSFFLALVYATTIQSYIWKYVINSIIFFKLRQIENLIIKIILLNISLFNLRSLLSFPFLSDALENYSFTYKTLPMDYCTNPMRNNISSWILFKFTNAKYLINNSDKIKLRGIDLKNVQSKKNMIFFLMEMELCL